MRRLSVSLFAVITARALSACGPCADGDEPAKGSCECSDGTELDPSECSICDSSGPESAVVTGTPIEGSVASVCPRDFLFDVGENAVLQVAIEGLEQNVKIAIERDGELVTELSASPGSPGRGDRNLAPGQYRATVSTNSPAGTPFRLSLLRRAYEWAEPVREPGNDQNTAQRIELPLPGTVWQTGGLVGEKDPEDYYRLELPENGTLSFSASNVLGNIELGLFVEDGIVNEAAPYVYRNAYSSTDAFAELVLEKRSYFLRVAAPSRSLDTLYRLDLSFEPYAVPQLAVEPSDEWSQALSVGLLGLAPLVLGGYVGRTDAADIYYFEVDDNGGLTISLEAQSAGLYAALFDDVPLPNAASSDQSVYADDSTTTDCYFLAQGAYYMRVYPYQANTDGLYTLSLSFGTPCPE